MKRRAFVVSVPLLGLAYAAGCTDQRSHAHAVYMLVDTSGSYAQEIGKAQLIVNYLLGSLQPGDSLAVARVRSRSFSEKDIIAKATFDNRPSQANAQKRALKEKVEAFTASAPEVSCAKDMASQKSSATCSGSRTPRCSIWAATDSETSNGSQPSRAAFSQNAFCSGSCSASRMARHSETMCGCGTCLALSRSSTASTSRRNSALTRALGTTLAPPDRNRTSVEDLAE